MDKANKGIQGNDNNNIINSHNPQHSFFLNERKNNIKIVSTHPSSIEQKIRNSISYGSTATSLVKVCTKTIKNKKENKKLIVSSMNLM